MHDSDEAQPEGGVHPASVAVARVAKENQLDVASLLDRVEQELLGGPRKYTPAQVAERAGMSREETRALWRALGFAASPDDDAVFTDSDVDALRCVQALSECGFEDPQLRAAMTRLFGQTFSRLASWQGQLLLEIFAEHPDILGTEDDVVALVEHITPVMESLQSYTWRRQLAAYFSRVAARADSGDAAGDRVDRPLAVGFADMSGFTALTRRSSEAELRELLETFESFATEIVGGHGGRIVKTIGDEVLFQADDAPTAAEIALDLVGNAHERGKLPDLRAGVALGPVVSRLGDVYGTTVNIASRLTTISRPCWVLVDREMHDQLADDPRYTLKSRRPESVRGYHHLRPWRLRRSTDR